MTEARRLYLDLLERVIINTIYNDPSRDPWGDTFDPVKREMGVDWPATAHSMIGARRIRSLRTMCETVLLEGVAGDFIETGVWRGGACILMRGVLAAHGDKSRRVWVADSFEGLPIPDANKYPADHGDHHHTFKQLAISLPQVQDNFRRYDLLDGQVIFLKGWFRDTLASADISKLAILRLDGDMYESTINALDALYEKVSSGGYVVVDDYGGVPNCRAAIHDFRQQKNVLEPLEDIDGNGVFWRKA